MAHNYIRLYNKKYKIKTVMKKKITCTKICHKRQCPQKMYHKCQAFFEGLCDSVTSLHLLFILLINLIIALLSLFLNDVIMMSL